MDVCSFVKSHNMCIQFVGIGESFEVCYLFIKNKLPNIFFEQPKEFQGLIRIKYSFFSQEDYRDILFRKRCSFTLQSYRAECLAFTTPGACFDDVFRAENPSKRTGQGGESDRNRWSACVGETTWINIRTTHRFCKARGNDTPQPDETV